jgi:uncharacterized protein (DUF1697 family)
MSRAAGRRYVAFLRAVNVGGRVVKMARLKELFERSGYRGVETFIASGNVIFDAAAGEPAALERRLEQILEADLGYPVGVFLRTIDEVVAIAEQELFGTLPGGARIYVGVLRAAPSPAIRRRVEAMNTEVDTFRVRARELYWLCAVPSRRSIMSAAILEKTVGMPATFRNINTMRRLAAKYRT